MTHIVGGSCSGHSEMRSFLLLLALGLASSDKLDRTYLPPPGSKFSGGSPGAIDVPLEYPKETYSTTLRPLPGQNNIGLFPGDSQLSVGIDRGTGFPSFPGGSQDFGTLTPGHSSQNSLNVPSTTTTYAFTQTTTFPTSEGFETTINPLDPSVSGFTIDNQQQIVGQGNFPQFPNQGQLINNGFPLGFGQPGKQIGDQHGFPPSPGATRPIPGSKTYFDARQPISQGQYLPAQRPISTESVPPGQYQGPTQHTGVQPPTTFTGQQGTYTTAIVPQGFAQGTTGSGLNVPQQFQKHSQRPIDSQGVMSTTVPSTYRPGSPQYDIQGVGPQGSNVYQQQFGERRPIQTINQQSIPSESTGYQPSTSQTGIRKPLGQGSNIPQQQFDGQRQRPLQTVGSQVVFPSTSRPQDFLTSKQPGLSQYETGFDNIQDVVAPDSNISLQFNNQGLGQQGVSPSTDFPQGIPSNQPGNTQYGTNVQSTIAPGYNIPQSAPGQQLQTFQNGRHPNLQVNQPSVPNQYDVQGHQQFSSTSKPGVLKENSQNVFQPGSTTSSTILPPGYSDLPGFSSTTPTILPSYGTTPSSNVYSTTPVYSGIQNQQNVPSSSFAHRSERPQAESDRNAVILNYDNVITPEGFAYSFDTSNGIHADESGTATDGVKAQGSYSYTGDDGKVYSIVYSADENGFQPRGDHLPTPPPIPEAIQRVIEQAAKDKEAGISHDGLYDEAKYGHSKYQGPMNRYRPHSQDRIVTNGADIPDDYESQRDDVGHKIIGSQSGIRRPISTNKDFIDEYEEEIDEDGQQPGGDVRDKNKRPTNRIPSRRPSSEVLKQNTYDNDGNIIETNRPTGSRIDVSGQKPSIIKDSRYRPMIPGSEYNRPGTSTKYAGSVDDNEEIFEETDSLDSEPGHIMSEANRRFPPNRLPTKTTGNQYTEEENGSYNQPGVSNIRHQSTTGRPKGTKRPGSTSTTYSKDHDDRIPNFDRNNRPLLPKGSPDTSVTTDNIETHDYSDQPGRYEQTVKGRPKATKRPGFSTTSEAQSSTTPLPGFTASQGAEYGDDRENPQVDTTFDQQGIKQPTFNPQTGILINKHPSRQEKPGTGYQYIPPQNRLQQDGENRYLSTGQGTTRRPFDVVETSDKTTTVHAFMTPNVSTEDGNAYEEDSKQKLPSRRPGYSTVNRVTTAPYPSENGHEDNFETNNGPEYYDREIYPQDGNKRIPHIQKPGKTLISSTRRPVYGQSQQPMRRPQYDEQFPVGQDRTTQKRPMRPGQSSRYPVDNSGISEGRPKPGYYEQRVTPGYGSESSKPSHIATSSVSPDALYEQTNMYQYPTTPDTISEYTDRVGSATRRPGSNSRMPSIRPTSRPTYSDRTPAQSRPGSNTFDTSTPGSITEYDEIVSPGSSVIRPGTSSPTNFGKPSGYDGTLHPGSTTIRPGSRLPGRPGANQIQNVPSTTYRPNYTFIDKTGQTEVTVDGFGRPISSEPSIGVPASSTHHPGYSVTSTTGLPAVESYQERQPSHIPGIDRIPGDFKSSVQGSRDQGLQRPQGQGPRQPYRGQSTTESIIGEDFSGPQQAQRFDPQTGYHY